MAHPSEAWSLLYYRHSKKNHIQGEFNHSSLHPVNKQHESLHNHLLFGAPHRNFHPGAVQ